MRVSSLLVLSILAAQAFVLVPTASADVGIAIENKSEDGGVDGEFAVWFGSENGEEVVIQPCEPHGKVEKAADCKPNTDLPVIRYRKEVLKAQMLEAIRREPLESFDPSIRTAVEIVQKATDADISLVRSIARRRPMLDLEIKKIEDYASLNGADAAGNRELTLLKEQLNLLNDKDLKTLELRSALKIVERNLEDFFRAVFYKRNMARLSLPSGSIDHRAMHTALPSFPKCRDLKELASNEFVSSVQLTMGGRCMSGDGHLFELIQDPVSARVAWYDQVAGVSWLADVKNNIDHFDAKKHCVELGGSMPTTDELELATKRGVFQDFTIFTSAPIAVADVGDSKTVKSQPKAKRIWARTVNGYSDYAIAFAPDRINSADGGASPRLRKTAEPEIHSLCILHDNQLEDK